MSISMQAEIRWCGTVACDEVGAERSRLTGPEVTSNRSPPTRRPIPFERLYEPSRPHNGV